MYAWKTETEMFSMMKERLYTPVVGDILDTMGYYHQFLPQEIRPLKEGMKLAGKADRKSTRLNSSHSSETPPSRFAWGG